MGQEAIQSGYPADRQPLWTFFPEACGNGTQYVDYCVVNSDANSDRCGDGYTAATMCSFYLDAVNKGTSYHHLKLANFFAARAVGSISTYEIVDGGEKPIRLDGWFGSNKEGAEKIADGLTEKTGKPFKAVLAEKRFVFANVWGVVVE